MVADSALKNCEMGFSLNQLLPNWSNALNNLFNVFIRWRCYQVALVWDMIKAYHSLKTLHFYIQTLMSYGIDSPHFLAFSYWSSVPYDVIWKSKSLGMDIQSMLKTGDKEKFLRLVVWRFGWGSEDWKTYGYGCVGLMLRRLSLRDPEHGLRD